MARSEASQSLTGAFDIRRLRADACLPNALEQSAAFIELRWECHRSPHEPTDGPASAGPPADGVSVVSLDLVHGPTLLVVRHFRLTRKTGASICLRLHEMPVAGILNCCHLGPKEGHPELQALAVHARPLPSPPVWETPGK